MDIYKRLKLVRQSKSLTIAQVSDKLGNTSYDRIEKGVSRLNFEDLLKICEILDVKIWDLVAKELIVKFSEEAEDPCYKTNDPCKYGCTGQCKESC